MRVILITIGALIILLLIMLFYVPIDREDAPPAKPIVMVLKTQTEVTTKPDSRFKIIKQKVNNDVNFCHNGDITIINTFTDTTTGVETICPMVCSDNGNLPMSCWLNPVRNSQYDKSAVKK